MLRHPGVFGEMGAVDRSQEQLAILRKYPDPVVVEFRRGGDFDMVVHAVKKNRYVEIRAACGAGKSTEIPLKLSQALGCLVIHTIPFHIAAHYLADYLISREKDGDKFVYMDDLESDMPRHGVVLMSTPFFHARRAYDNFRGVENAVLYLDESHESDCWTAALRALAPAMKSFRVAKASATSAPGVQMTTDLPSRCDRLTYPRVDVSTWSASDKDVPWAASRIQTNVMMCIDRKQTRRNLAAQYDEYGFTVRDCSDEDYAYFQESMRMLRDPRDGIIVVMVDYKFRSSFSIPGTNVFIDSCEVAVPIVQDGAPKVVYRAAYDFEVQQFLGRGGRMAGTPAKLYRSSEPSPKRMCDLESLECDGANLLFRMVSFRPPLELVEYPYFKGDVPMDIAAAMASSQPLRLYPQESLVPWVNGHKALVEEKQKAAYAYDLAVTRKAKVASCHTVMDVDRKRSPPPPVPKRHRTLAVDVDGLDEYRSSRESSPSAVFTLDTEVYDNLSAARDASAERPKRVAKRVLEARAAEAAALERSQDEARQQAALVVAADVAPLDAGDPVVQGGGVAGTGLVRSRTALAARTPGRDVPVSTPAAFTAPVEAVRPMYSFFRERERHGPDIKGGQYYHYHGMESAPEHSTVFLRGVNSIVSFCEDHSARRYVSGLPEADKLYAMRVLVDASNNSTAIAMGMQRLFQEVSGRPPEQWKAIVDHAAMMDEIEWMIARCSEEQAKVKVYHNVIPLFAKYDLEPISAPLELEHRVMLEVMERFERVAVKKDPDKSYEYWQRLNGRGIALSPRSSARAREREFYLT